VVASQLQTRHCIFKRLPSADLSWKPSSVLLDHFSGEQTAIRWCYCWWLTLAGFMARLTGLVGPIPSARAGAGKPLEQNDYTCNLHRCIFLESNKPACWVHGCLTLECGCVFSMSESGRTLTRATPGDQTLIVGTSYNGCDSSKHFPSTASAAILISHSLVPRMVIIFHRQHQFPDLRYLAQRVPLRLSFPRDA
jgi:hypothetical protein